MNITEFFNKSKDKLNGISFETKFKQAFVHLKKKTKELSISKIKYLCLGLMITSGFFYILNNHVIASVSDIAASNVALFLISWLGLLATRDFHEDKIISFKTDMMNNELNNDCLTLKSLDLYKSICEVSSLFVNVLWKHRLITEEQIKSNFNYLYQDNTFLIVKDTNGNTVDICKDLLNNTSMINPLSLKLFLEKYFNSEDAANIYLKYIELTLSSQNQTLILSLQSEIIYSVIKLHYLFNNNRMQLIYEYVKKLFKLTDTELTFGKLRTIQHHSQKSNMTHIDFLNLLLTDVVYILDESKFNHYQSLTAQDTSLTSDKKTPLLDQLTTSLSQTDKSYLSELNAITENCNLPADILEQAQCLKQKLLLSKVN